MPRWITGVPFKILLPLLTGIFVLIAVMIIFAMNVNAPLEELANPDQSPNPAKAPWYFMGIQELLLHFHPLIAAMIVPALGLGTLFALPYLDADLDSVGIWFRSRKGRRMGLVAAGVGLVATPLLVLVDEFIIDFAGWLPSLPTLISNGVVPLAIVLLLLFVFYDVTKKQFQATQCETLQSTFILVLVAFVMLTIIGIWFRGPGMALMWPWDVAAATLGH